MKIILTQPLAGRGKTGTIVEVSDAYARNYLIPRGLAKPATAEAVTVAMKRQKLEQQLTAKAKANQDVARSKLQGQIITIASTAGTSGRLFAGLRQKDIVEALTAFAGLPLDDVRLDPDHLKETGTHALTIIWPDRSQAVVQVKVEAKKT